MELQRQSSIFTSLEGVPFRNQLNTLRSLRTNLLSADDITIHGRFTSPAVRREIYELLSRNGAQVFTNAGLSDESREVQIFVTGRKVCKIEGMVARDLRCFLRYVAQSSDCDLNGLHIAATAAVCEYLMSEIFPKMNELTISLLSTDFLVFFREELSSFVLPTNKDPDEMLLRPPKLRPSRNAQFNDGPDLLTKSYPVGFNFLTLEHRICSEELSPEDLNLVKTHFSEDKELQNLISIYQ